LGKLIWWAFHVNLLTFGVLAVAGAACLVAGAVTSRRAATRLTAAGLWIAATVLVPAHARFVYLQGEGPIIC
jgi:hypothetical protein